ncbi:MAG: TolC family protein [Candidatus Gastranaerophilales bacterium]|nr:TolC family protein [Candidatus Gastranaerophilales bacterium]
MRKVYHILFFALFIFQFALCKEELFDLPVDLEKKTKVCNLSEFCDEYIKDIDIEKYIKDELKSDYIIVSLDECLDIALKNNFDIKIKDHSYLSSKYEYKYAMSNFLPILSFTTYLTDYRGNILVGGILDDTFHETALSVNATIAHQLTEGGRQIFQANALRALKRATRHDYHYTISQTVFYAFKYYYEMLLAKLNIEIYLRNLIERNAQLKLAQNLNNSGFGTKFDVIRSENEKAEAKIDLLGALNQFRISQSKLAYILGIDPKTSLMPFEKEVDSLELLDDGVMLEHYIEMALNYREDLKEYKDLITFEKQTKNMLMTDFVPKPSINVQGQYQGTIGNVIKPNYIVTLYLSWLPDSNSIWGSLAKIRSQKEKIKIKILQYQNRYRLIQEQIVQNFSNVDFNKKQMLIAKKRVDFSQESIKLAMIRFNYGKGILLDVIQAQSQMTQARVEYVSSIIKYNISQAQLLFDCGKINKDDIIKIYSP